MKHLIILGAGGFGREVYCSATESIGYGVDFDIKGFLDPNPNILDGFNGYPPIIGDDSSYIIEEDDVFICANGNVRLKQRICEYMLSRGASFITLIHKTAYLSKNTKLGQGCLILAGARIHCDVTIEDFVVVQPYAIVGHDVKIGKWSHINALADCGGMSRIGVGVTLHTTCFVIPGAVVEDYSTVGAGSVTLRRVKAGSTVYGIPAKPIALPKSNK